jgi:ubiquinone/menaquinone biosynthesis C-methylase UbiE
MAEEQIRFDDGAAYERMMGIWSRHAGEIFLDWVAPPQGLRWIDIGCGNGAFTQLLIDRCAPAAVEGIDPSDGQLEFARTRPAGRVAKFSQGQATALLFPENTFDAAVMALVIFFVPDPAKGVAEMARVVCPGGTIAAYAWDMLGGGFPLEPIYAEMRAMGTEPLMPPSASASRIETMRDLWTAAALDDVETREIVVQRTFADFEEFWTISVTSPGFSSAMATIAADDRVILKARVRARLQTDAAGRVICNARANAVKGRVPKQA